MNQKDPGPGPGQVALPPEPTPAPSVRRFVVIGGMHRSGTTLVRSILNGHPDVGLLKPELDFLGPIARGARVVDVLGTERVRPYVTVTSQLLAQPPPVVYRTILSDHAERLGRPIAGEKTPLNEFWYDQLASWIPGDQLQFVHVVRDPLEMIASFKHASFRRQRGYRLGRSLLTVLARNWLRSASLGLARQFRNPAGYRLQRYEDLVAEPEAQVADLARFLGVAEAPAAMLEASRYPGNSSFPETTPAAARVAGAVYRPESRARWLTPGETRRATAIVGEIAGVLGYGGRPSGQAGPIPYPWSPITLLRSALTRRHAGPASTAPAPVRGGS